MKDFKVGQTVYTLSRDYIHITGKGVIIKSFSKSNRWKVKYAEREWGNYERFRKDNEVFATPKEAYEEAMRLFDNKLSHIEENRDRFKLDFEKMLRAETQTSASPTSNEGMELSLNPIPSQLDNENNNGSGTKPSSRGI